MKTFRKIAILALCVSPVLASAQLNMTYDLISRVGDIVKLLTVVAAAIALLVFFWGLVKFIFKVGGDEKAVTEGRKMMIWGIIALFVMMSVWGIVSLIQSELGLKPFLDNNIQTSPSTQTPPNTPFNPNPLKSV